MRANKKNQTVIWIILGLLAIGLVGFGGAGQGGGTIRSVGKVGDENISVNDYVNGVNQSIAQISQQFGRTVTPNEAQAFGVQQSVLDDLMTRAALDNEATRIGISIGDAAVRDRLLSTPNFQGLDGSFDVEGYEYTLERSGLSPSEYETSLRKEVARSLLQSSIIAGLENPNTQTNALLAFDRETRNLTWAELSSDALETPIGAPSDTDIQTQYEETPSAYTAPLTREITYAWLSPDMLSDRVQIDEAQIRESYDLQSDRFNRPERRSVERIVFGDLGEAEDARLALDAETTTFDLLLADRGLTSADAQLGEVEPKDLATEAADVIFMAEGPGVIGPVQSSLGPAIFRINAILAEDVTSLDDARAEIIGELAGEEARRMVSDVVNDIEDLLAGGATPQDLADQTDMELGSISMSAQTTDGIAAYENFRNIANQSQPDDFAEVQSLDDGGIFALVVNEIKQPALRPLEEVRDQVVADWERAETVRQLTNLAEAIKSSIESGDGFGELTTKLETDVRRVGFIENTPNELLTSMFDAKTGDVTITAGTESVFIAQLDQINSFDPQASENQAVVNAVNQQLYSTIANDVLSAFALALRQDAGISINQVAIEQINLQLSGGGHGGGY